MGAVFAEFGWGKIDDDFAPGETKEGIMDSGTDTIAAFVDTLAGHTDNIKTGKTLIGIPLDGY